MEDLCVRVGKGRLVIVECDDLKSLWQLWVVVHRQFQEEQFVIVGLPKLLL